jgi:L-fucose mutarotase/ribose pyranase (RbsD/FucU family)
MALLSLNTTQDALHTLQYASAADQLVYTDAVARQAATVTRAVLDFDLHTISQQIAQAIVSALR